MGTEQRLDDALRRLAAGDPEAMAQAYAQYGQAVFEIALRLTRSDSDAQDVVHDVFLRLPEMVGGYRGDGSFEAWIRRIAARRSLQILRATKRRAEELFDETLLSPADATAGEPISGLGLEAAIGGLPGSLRSVFLLKEVEGYSHREIAKMLDITEAASQKRLSRAYTELRKTLAK